MLKVFWNVLHGQEAVWSVQKYFWARGKRRGVTCGGSRSGLVRGVKVIGPRSVKMIGGEFKGSRSNPRRIFLCLMCLFDFPYFSGRQRS